MKGWVPEKRQHTDGLEVEAAINDVEVGVVEGESKGGLKNEDQHLRATYARFHWTEQGSSSSKREPWCGQRSRSSRKSLV